MCDSIEKEREIRLHLKNNYTVPRGSLTAVCFLAVHLQTFTVIFKRTPPSSPFYTFNSILTYPMRSECPSMEILIHIEQEKHGSTFTV